MSLLLALAAATVPVALGVVVLTRSPQRVIGALLVAHGVSAGLVLGHPEAPSSGRTGMVADQLSQGTWVFIFLWLALVAYLLPDGQTASRRWRVWVRVGLVGVVLFLVGAAGDSEGFAETHAGAPLPVAWLPGWMSGLFGVVGLVLVGLLLVGSVVATLQRLHRASDAARLQLLWPVWGALTVPATLVFGWLNHFLLGDRSGLFDVAVLLMTIALPTTMAIAVLQHQLLDIELALSRTLTYSALSLLVVGAYAGMLVLADRLIGSRSVGGLVAVALVAVAIHPTYAFLRRRVERWVYGYRSDPAIAVRRLGTSLESADPLHVIETISASVADALRVTDVWVEPAGSTVGGDNFVRAPLVHRGQHVGDLAVRVPAGRHLSAADIALLNDLARHAAVTVRAGQLASELQRSRSRIVTAREEERRRLRRDLHDGVGPSLAAIVLKLGAVQTLEGRAERDALLAEIRAETSSTITELRRAVDDLRPPAIDEVGLVGAIRQRAASLSTGALVYEVHGPVSLPPIPAAVEVAAFRIASEAMTNVAKHAAASRCVVAVELDGTLSLTVTDNGQGSALPTGQGVGLTSMAERAAELGGSCTISTRAEGGLAVRALLPLHEWSADDVSPALEGAP